MKVAARALGTCLGNRQQKTPVSVEEFKSTAEILSHYRVSWLTQATLFISKQYQPSSSVPTTEELQEQEDSN